MRKYVLFLLLLIPAFQISAQNCSKYSDAESAYNYFMSAYETIRSLEYEEQQKLVRAICEADDDEQESVSRDVASRVESMIYSNIDQLQRSKEKAETLFKEVLENKDCQDKHSNIRDFQSRVTEIWGRIERMKRRVTAGNNPVTALLNNIGKAAHKTYQNDNSSKGIAEFSISAGRIDFITNSDNGCIVIEVKPNNSRAISKGVSQVRDYTTELNNNVSKFKDLLDKDSKFMKCGGRFKAKVVCYTFCPTVKIDGEVIATSLQWSTCWEQ